MATRPFLCAGLLALSSFEVRAAQPGAASGAPTFRPLVGSRESVAAFDDGQTLVVFAHQDDDLLWMLPFWPKAARFLLTAYPATAQFEGVVDSFPPGLHYRARWIPIWSTVDNDVWAEVFTDRCVRAPIVTLASLKAHLRPYFAPPIRRVVTHDNWGEYGHAQHRLVSLAVRQLAVEAGMDVWALGTRLPMSATEQSQYVDVAKDLGLPTIEGWFEPDVFRTVRAAYLACKPVASTPELQAKFLAWSPTLWTWPDEPEAFPMGWRPFVKLVDKGVDLTAGNAAVKALEADVPVINDCAANPAWPGLSRTP